MPELLAVGWDHPRCRAPMEAAGATWARLTGTAIAWEFRPLAAFNDQPVADLAGQYDLAVIDHPMVPAAASRGCLVPFDEHLTPGELDEIARSVIGRSHHAYSWESRQWALAVDAACHVSCGRPDLLARQGAAWPGSWDDVLELAVARPGTVALPLGPADAVCALVTVTQTMGAPLQLGAGVDRGAVALLCRLATLVDPRSFGLAPPQLLAWMNATDDVAYAPLTFGYRPLPPDLRRTPHRLAFGPVPGTGSSPGRPILGGAGLAVLSRGGSVEPAVAFARWACRPEVQADVILGAGGQPAARVVWEDARADAATGGFLASTRASLESALVRPRDPRWPAVQQRLGEQLHAGLVARAPAQEVAASLDDVLSAALPVPA